MNTNENRYIEQYEIMSDLLDEIRKDEEKVARERNEEEYAEENAAHDLFINPKE